MQQMSQGQPPPPGSHPPVPSANPTILDSVASTPETRKLVQISGRQITHSFSGPTPPPEVLQGYEQLVPGSAARLLQQAERQTDHRINLERMVTTSDVRRSWAGLICGFVLCSSCIGGGILCVLQGHDVAGAGIATAAVVGLAGAFIYGTASRKSERQQKTALMVGKDQPS